MKIKTTILWTYYFCLGLFKEVELKRIFEEISKQNGSKSWSVKFLLCKNVQCDDKS